MIDFPRAWQIAQSEYLENHDKKCSFRVTRGGMLCVCHVVYTHPELLSDLFIGKDGKIIEKWARINLRHMWE